MTEEQFVVDEKKLKRELNLWGERRFTEADFIDLDRILEHCRLPIQPPTRIEAAIKALRNDKPRPSFLDRFNGYDLANLLAWAFGQKQWVDGQYANMTWADVDFGLDKETPNQKEG